MKSKLLMLSVAAVLTACGGGETPVTDNGRLAPHVQASVQLDIPIEAKLATVEVTPAAVAPINLGTVEPNLTNVSAKVYNPSQIRVAYQMPVIPVGTPTPAQAAALGAGQTIYVVDAYGNPRTVDELAAFNKNFNLPGCTEVKIPVTATLPLASASKTSCEISVVYSSGTKMTTTVPQYSSGWAMETSLDVQWAHATAPLARIVLIAADNSSVASMMNAINLANAMGPGVVSMSFGIGEGSWVQSMDTVFSNSQMTYVASTGDSSLKVGAQWPAVSSKVLAVGATSLTSYNELARTESVWSLSGGGRSAYVPVPAYQNSKVPGVGNQQFRSAVDVAFNGDPATGQYVANMTPTGTVANWYSVGGTSLSAPQWAGLIASTNAVREAAGKPKLGIAQTYIYKLAEASDFWQTSFADVMTGIDAGYSATSGYDIVAGLGTPNVQTLVSRLTNTSVVLNPPVMPPNMTVQAVAGTPLSFKISASYSGTPVWSINGGASIDSTGQVTWLNPVQGTFAFTVTLTDSSGLSAQTVVTVVVAAPVAPIAYSNTIYTNAATPVKYQVQYSAANPVKVISTGSLPTGLTVSTTGLIAWSKPVLGTWYIYLDVVDAKTCATTKIVIVISVTKAVYLGPQITLPTAVPVAGVAYTGLIGISDTDPGVTAVSVTLKGLPSGMTATRTGTGVTLSWSKPIAGAFAITVTAQDNLYPSYSSQKTIQWTVK